MEHAIFTIGRESWSSTKVEIHEDGNLIAENYSPSMFSSKSILRFMNGSEYVFEGKSMFDSTQMIKKEGDVIGKLSTKNYGSKNSFLGLTGEYSIIPKKWGREFTIIDENKEIEVAKVSSKTKGFNTTYGIAIKADYDAYLILVIFIVTLRLKNINEGNV